MLIYKCVQVFQRGVLYVRTRPIYDGKIMEEPAGQRDIEFSSIDNSHIWILRLACIQSELCHVGTWLVKGFYS